MGSFCLTMDIIKIYPLGTIKKQQTSGYSCQYLFRCRALNNIVGQTDNSTSTCDLDCINPGILSGMFYLLSYAVPQYFLIPLPSEVMPFLS